MAETQHLYKFVDAYFAWEEARRKKSMAWVKLGMEPGDKPIIITHKGKRYCLSCNGDGGPRFTEVVDYTLAALPQRLLR